MTSFLSCYVFLLEAWWPNGEHLKVPIWRCRFGVLLLCCFLIKQETLLHFVPDLHQLRRIKGCWLWFFVILFSIWFVKISSRFEQIWCLQLFQERLLEKMCMWQSRKVAWDIIKLYTVPDNSSCWTNFCCFPSALANICPWPLVPFFQISLKNSELKATHNTFRGCCVHFLWQSFSK